MAHRDLSLTAYEIQDGHWLEMAAMYDSDYNGDNGAESHEYWEKGSNPEIPLAIELGFKNEAERRIKNLISKAHKEEGFDADSIGGELSDEEYIEMIMEDIEKCWGSTYVSNFSYISSLNDDVYEIVIAYNY